MAMEANNLGDGSEQSQTNDKPHRPNGDETSFRSQSNGFPSKAPNALDEMGTLEPSQEQPARLHSSHHDTSSIATLSTLRELTRHDFEPEIVERIRRRRFLNAVLDDAI